MMGCRIRFKSLGGILLLMTSVSQIRADWISSISMSGGGASANATFTQIGTSQLKITLSNTSTGLTYNPANVLTALFWDMSMSLTRVSATTSPGNIIQSQYSLLGLPDVPEAIAAGNVSGEFAYRYLSTGLDSYVGNQKHGVSSSGLDIFGAGDRFGTLNLAGPDSPDGVQYGLSTLGGIELGSDGKPKNGGLKQTLIQSSVDLLFCIESGAYQGSTQAGFDALFTNIRFQYGTATDEPHLGSGSGPGPSPVPVPAGIVLFGIGGALMAATSHLRNSRLIKLGA